MKKHGNNIPKSDKQSDIIKFVSRNESFERNGGGQFVSITKIHRNKKKYNRNDKKKELRNNLNSYFFQEASNASLPSLQN